MKGSKDKIHGMGASRLRPCVRPTGRTRGWWDGRLAWPGLSWAVHFVVVAHWGVAATPPSGVQLSVPRDILLPGYLCVPCYDQPYSHPTTVADIETCRSVHEEGWIGMGAKSSAGASSYSLLAFIRASDLVPSSSTSVAYGANGAYWYYYSGKSVGFAASTSITLGVADIASSGCDYRLSWHLRDGGWRAGCTKDLNGNSNWRKIILACNVCPAGKS